MALLGFEGIKFVQSSKSQLIGFDTLERRQILDAAGRALQTIARPMI
jgi:hypothetical protein